MNVSNGFSTGLNLLDREINGGFPPGSIVLLNAPAASQSEQFLYRFAQPRKTLYSTTVRSNHSVRDGIKRTRQDISIPTIEDHTESPLNQVQKAVRRLEQNSTLIVDTVDEIEENEKTDYKYFLNNVQNEIMNTDSIVIFHGIKSRHSSQNRILTEQVADIVFELTQRKENRQMVTTLTVRKYRGGVIPEEPIKLDLTDGISIDPSRDIS